MSKDKKPKSKKVSKLSEAAAQEPPKSEKKKMKKRKASELGAAAAPAVVSDAEQPVASKKVKKSKKEQPVVEAVAVVEPAASPASEKKTKKAKRKEQPEPATASPSIEASADKKSSKKKAQQAAADYTLANGSVAAVVENAATVPASEQPPKKKQKRQHEAVADVDASAPAAAAEALIKKAKKTKRKDKDSKLEIQVGQPADDAASAGSDPARPTQAIAVAMPEEAVEELAGAIQDANGGPIKIVSNGPDDKQRRGSGGGRAFQRVKADEWLDQKGSLNNSYQATFGDEGWGAKAQQVLGQVRGKDFRHEKTKKKRGTYKGGQIDFKVNSFKYDSD